MSNQGLCLKCKHSKVYYDDLVDTLNKIAMIVDHRGPKCGEDLIATVKSIVEDRDAKSRLLDNMTFVNP